MVGGNWKSAENIILYSFYFFEGISCFKVKFFSNDGLTVGAGKATIPLKNCVLVPSQPLTSISFYKILRVFFPLQVFFLFNYRVFYSSGARQKLDRSCENG